LVSTKNVQASLGTGEHTSEGSLDILGEGGRSQKNIIEWNLKKIKGKKNTLAKYMDYTEIHRKNLRIASPL
jgi:RecB family endonuclease NucS